MHECKGNAEIKLLIKIPIEGQFNSNYRSGIEELEECAQEMVVSLLPSDFVIEVLDVTIKDYELKDAEREVENED